MTGEQIAQWYDYLNHLAISKYTDCPDLDDLIQETMLAAINSIEKGQTIDFPKAFLKAVLNRKYNQWLRSKYKNRTDYPDMEFWGQIPEEEPEEEQIDRELYEKVRREIGRLTELYRESVIRYYVKGLTVEQIASELGVPKGTVLSRLSHGRKQVKEGLTQMENYSEMSWAPKSVRIGIWGGPNGKNEPFSLIPGRSSIEANMLVAAYEKPMSLREVAGTL
ncbi:MAG: RNA polymerase sigma factor [Eubacteriales bacterium]